jgi:serine/threonine protein kinase
VFKGKWKEKDVAVKQLNATSLSDDEAIQSFLLEIALFSEFKHPNIAHFEGAVLGHVTLCLLLEYYSHGTLSAYLKSAEPKIAFKVKHRFMTEIASALDYLHTLEPPIVHRDLKAANILVSEALTTKLSDFGVATRLNPGPMNSKKGTVHWTAPEVLLLDIPFTKKSDIYSLAVTFWEILNDGTLPFAGKNVLEVIRAVETGERPPLSEEVVEPNLVKLLKKCWSEPSQRPPINEVLKAIEGISRDRKSDGGSLLS